MFAGSAEVTPYLRILGALWLAMGAVADLGLADPLRFSPLLLLYKSAWLLAVAYLALLRGSREPGLIVFSGVFTAWVLTLLLIVPFGPARAVRRPAGRWRPSRPTPSNSMVIEPSPRRARVERLVKRLLA